jgi:hypothetical protein
MTMRFRAIHLLALLAALLLSSGCASIIREEDDANGNEMPWNTPAPWEGQGIGLPM